jgi:16S rRNA G966 N2-methylase RsmD
MRIIAGSRRGTKLTKLDAANTRPTADRVRESLFNILDAGRFRRILDGAVVIDAFAGTGALGLEALSRGAESAYFIEQDPVRAPGFTGEYPKTGYAEPQPNHCWQRQQPVTLAASASNSAVR